MSKYEMMLIVNPSLTDEDREKSITSLKELLESNSAKIEKEDVWGIKKLAYKINRSNEGFYILYDLELDGTKIKEMSKTINLNKNIWRYMFVKKDA